VSFLRYSLSKNVVTLKSGSEVTQGHRKWYHSIHRYGFPLVVYSNFVRKMHRLWDIRHVTAVTLKLGLQVTQGHGNWHGSIRHLWFPINVPYRFRDKRRFLSKIAKFSHPLLFCIPTDGIPLNRRRESKTRMMALPGRQRSLTISSAVWIECTNVTDKHSS